MPFPALSKTTQKRAIAQASSNTESSEARVVKTYADALGNITAADVVVKGQVASLFHVANASGIKLYNGATVEVRSLTGNVHARQITGAAGSSTTGAVSAQQAADSVAVSGPPPVPSSLSDAPVLLQSASTGTAGGYVELPGANVVYTDTDPGTGSGGAAISGQRLVDVKPLVVVSLPAVPTTLRDGTLVCLIDSYNNSQGLWRLDGAAQVWRRVDVGSVKATAATFGTVETDITEANGSVVYTKTTTDSTFATKTALAQTTNEVVAARTNQNGTLFGNLKARVDSIPFGVGVYDAYQGNEFPSQTTLEFDAPDWDIEADDNQSVYITVPPLPKGTAQGQVPFWNQATGTYAYGGSITDNAQGFVNIAFPNHPSYLGFNGVGYFGTTSGGPGQFFTNTSSSDMCFRADLGTLHLGAYSGGDKPSDLQIGQNTITTTKPFQASQLLAADSTPGASVSVLNTTLLYKNGLYVSGGVPLATSGAVGLVKPGANLTVGADGSLSGASGIASWGVRGNDTAPAGTPVFNINTLSPTWTDLYPSATGDLNFSSASPQSVGPIAGVQQVVFSTRLFVPAAKTIHINVTTSGGCSVILNAAQVGTDANASTGTVNFALNLAAGWNGLSLCYQNNSISTYQLLVQGVGGGLASLVGVMSGYVPAPRRTAALSFAPNKTAADTGPDTTQMRRLPSSLTGWVPTLARLHVDTPGTTATTFQGYYSGISGAFGSGSPVLSATLSAGTTRDASSTAFTGAIPGGSLVCPAFSPGTSAAGIFSDLEFTEA